VAFARAVLDGLSKPQKSVPGEWLYDQRGADLFEQIAELPEYYATRTEIELLDRHAGEIAAAVGAGAVVVEYGQGTGRKTPLLLAALERPQAYLPMVRPANNLDEALRRLRRDFSGLVVHPLRADFGAPVNLPGRVCEAAGARLGFVPGSTLGSLSPDAAVAFLQGMANTLGPRGMMLIGVDMTRDSKLLMPAHDDAAGVTEAFNRNLLRRINRELDADFLPAAFRYRARYDPALGRVEMHLVSRWRQHVQVLGQGFDFATGESIRTENSYKYLIADFQALAQRAGWSAARCWYDTQQRFSLHLLRRAPAWAP
jgi:dimethylhistidine N-methyltransferase